MEKSETEPGRIGRNPVSRPFRPRLRSANTISRSTRMGASEKEEDRLVRRTERGALPYGRR